jgi:radical SAM protein with 4Fe4S-binding SPASM domain
LTENTENYIDEFSYDECIDIINQISECGIEEVYITGGEPLLHPNFFDIIDKFIEKNINISIISTNGSLINKDFINKIKKRKISPTFCISFDGIGYHDWMRGVKGAEAASINAIKLLVDEGFSVICESCWHKDNISTLIDTAQLMSDLGVTRFKTYRTSEAPRWLLNGGKDRSLSFKEYYDSCLSLIDTCIKRQWRMQMKLIGFFYFDPVLKNNYILCDKASVFGGSTKHCICPKARHILFIASDGRLLPCNPFSGKNKELNQNWGNIKDNKLKDLLTDSEYLKLVTSTVDDLYAINKKCRECKYNAKCMGGCRAIAYGFSNDFFGVDESKCYFFENKYEEKISEIIRVSI